MLEAAKILLADDHFPGLDHNIWLTNLMLWLPSIVIDVVRGKDMYLAYRQLKNILLLFVLYRIRDHRAIR